MANLQAGSFGGSTLWRAAQIARTRSQACNGLLRLVESLLVCGRIGEPCMIFVGIALK